MRIGTSKRFLGADYALLEPDRTALRMRRDHLVGAERAQAVLDRLEGIRVADLALGRDAEPAQPLQAPLEALCAAALGLSSSDAK